MIRQQFERRSENNEKLPERGGDEKSEPSGRWSEGGLEQPDEIYQRHKLPEKIRENRQELPQRGSGIKQEWPRRGSDKSQNLPGRGSG